MRIKRNTSPRVRGVINWIVILTITTIVMFVYHWFVVSGSKPTTRTIILDPIVIEVEKKR